MDRIFRALLTLAAATFWAASGFAQTTPHYLIANANHPRGNYATFFTIGTDGNFTSETKIPTGGRGAGAPAFGNDLGSAPQAAVFHSQAQDCFFVSDGGSSDIAAIDSSLKVVGRFHGGTSDFGTIDGMALVINKGFLYAGFSGDANDLALPSTLASYKIQSDCQLKYLGSVQAVGLVGWSLSGHPIGLAAHGGILVAAYGDGSIESFHFSQGFAKSNGDLQNSTGYYTTGGYYPQSVDISSDGKFAIFGDTPGNILRPAVEVADISAGSLNKPTVVYYLGKPGSTIPSGRVRLSPDESLLYLSESVLLPPTRGVAAAFFNKTTGAVTLGCSSHLRDPNQEWWLTGNVAFANNSTGTGGTLYVPENSFAVIGNDELVATVDVTSDGKTCSFTESKKSPFELQRNSLNYGSVVSSPPRAF